jgi:TonB family protein
MKVRVSARTVLAATIVFGGAGVVAQTPAPQDHTIEVKRKVKSKVLPEYPVIAKQLHLQGKVKIEVTVAADGHVVSTKVMGGNPVLASAAIDAIKKWRFEPAPKETTELIESDFNGQD